MKKWEYTSRNWRKADTIGKKLDTGLNIMGKKGWELVDKTEHQEETNEYIMPMDHIVWIFKRPIQ